MCLPRLKTKNFISNERNVILQSKISCANCDAELKQKNIKDMRRRSVDNTTDAATCLSVAYFAENFNRNLGSF